MDAEATRELLEGVAAGRTPVQAALDELQTKVMGDGHGFADLGYARVDTHRALRTGDPEVIYAAGKTPEQVAAIAARLHEAHPEHPVLVTRAEDGHHRALRDAFGELCVEDPVARMVSVGPPPRPQGGRVTVVCAGTSDLPVATEAAFTARVCGAEVNQVTDVGVAGIHRLLAARDVLAAADCLVVVAGMDGALPSAVGGLVGVPIIAVPTSVGYGAAFGGLAALLTMLNSCAPGVTVVNIDNGFGAGLAAARIVRGRKESA